MITLQVGTKEVELPEKLSISQYQELRKVDDLQKDPVGFLSALSGLSTKDIKYANRADMEFALRFFTEQYLGKQDTKLKPIIEHEGVEYGLMSEIHTLNFGGWVDLEFLTTDGVEKNIEKIMAIMYRPIVEKTPKGFIIEEYDHDKMEIRAEIFKDLPVEDFWGVSNFFFNLVKAYTKNTKASLEYQRTKEIALTRLRMMNPLYHLYKRYPDFIGRVSWPWLKRILQRWTK